MRAGRLAPGLTLELFAGNGPHLGQLAQTLEVASVIVLRAEGTNDKACRQSLAHPVIDLPPGSGGLILGECLNARHRMQSFYGMLLGWGGGAGIESTRLTGPSHHHYCGPCGVRPLLYKGSVVCLYGHPAPLMIHTSGKGATMATLIY